MNSEKFYRQKLWSILGAEPSINGEVSIAFEFNDHAEAKNGLQLARNMQRDLRALKRDVNQTCKEIRAEFTTKRTSVGKSLGAGLASALIGRRTIGGLNAARRDDLRRTQHDTILPYQDLKLMIDDFVYKLDKMKHRIQTSRLYQEKPKRNSVATKKPPSKGHLKQIQRKFFVYSNEKVRGPFEEGEIATLLKAGSIDAETLLCSEGEEDWHPLGHYFEL